MKSISILTFKDSISIDVEKGIIQIPQFEIDTDPNSVTYGNICQSEEFITIKLCKGTKDNPVQTGTLSEVLITSVIMYLEQLNVPPLNTRYTALAITNLEEAINWMRARTIDRVDRGVLNTMEK